ncbi:MAG: archease [Actinobacteria bacterium]|nr:archease [Actinomycetota bacterium]
MPYEILSHTADTGIEATSPTLTRLIADLATGMFALMAEPARSGDVEVRVEASAATPEDLVVDLLSELLYQSEIDDVHLSGFDVEAMGELEFAVKARGVPLSEIDLTGPPIKAVTYHQVSVEETGDGWRARVYFDV